MLEEPIDRIGPLVDRHAQDMVQVVLLHQEFHVPGIVHVVGGLEPLNLFKGGRVHRRHQDVVRVGVVSGTARHHVGDDETL